MEESIIYSLLFCNLSSLCYYWASNYYESNNVQFSVSKLINYHFNVFAMIIYLILLGVYTKWYIPILFYLAQLLTDISITQIVSLIFRIFGTHFYYRDFGNRPSFILLVVVMIFNPMFMFLMFYWLFKFI